MTRLMKTMLALGVAILSPFVHGEPLDASPLVAVDRTPLDHSLDGRVVSYAEPLKKARAAVVSVYPKSLSSAVAKQVSSSPAGSGRRVGSGSGVIVSADGYILTHSRVLGEGAELEVRIERGDVFEAKLIGIGPHTGVAVIKIEAVDLPYIVLADSSQLEVGDVVFALGSSLDSRGFASMGIVSAEGGRTIGIHGGDLEDLIQTDFPIGPGSLGGPLIDAHGRLVGISTAIESDETSVGSPRGGLAVPANLARSVLLDLTNAERSLHGFLGVEVEESASIDGLAGAGGVVVRRVEAGSSAESAGIEPGDAILEVDGEPIDSLSDLRVTVARKEPGATVDVVVARDSERLTLSAKLTQKEDGAPSEDAEPARDPNARFLEGVTVEALKGDLRERFSVQAEAEGVVITEVSPSSPYARVLPVGMVIEKINGRKVESVSDAKAYLKPAGKNILLVTYRGVRRWVAVERE